jgi:hypothetical protein
VDSGGNPLTTDIEGNARIFGSAVDIGAYEFDTWNFILQDGGTTHFIDADGSHVTISYKGLGSATIVRSPSNLGPAGQTWGDIQTITIDGSDAKSVLTIKVTGHNPARETNVEDITVHGRIKAITADRTNLTGDLSIGGAISALTLDDVLGGTISIGAPVDGDTKTAAKIKLHQVIDANLSSETPIGSLAAAEWLNTDGLADVISAPWIGRLRISGSRRAPMPNAGDFGADLELSGENARGISLGRFKAAGAITGGDWTIAYGAKFITMGSSSAAWIATFGTDGAWADITGIMTTIGNLSGQITARSIDRIRTKGVQTDAVITLNP